MRDEEEKFTDESYYRDRRSHFLQNLRSPPDTNSLEESLAAISGIPHVMWKPVPPYPRTREVTYVNKMYPNCWSNN